MSLRLPKDELEAHIYLYLKDSRYTSAAQALEEANPKAVTHSRKIGTSALTAASKELVAAADSDSSDDEPVRKPVAKKPSPKQAPKKAPIAD
ncbi:hypothetical protein, conserved, partial [Leishmania donovani]